MNDPDSTSHDSGYGTGQDWARRWLRPVDAPPAIIDATSFPPDVDGRVDGRVCAVWSMLMPFPSPPFSVSETLNDLALVRAGDDDAIAELGGADTVLDLPRPWDPSTCPPGLRERVWLWVDQVATWLNHEYAWRASTLIPPCWPAHPHLARELPVLACLRHQAGQAFAPDLLEDWHRYALPHFLDRMAARLGDSGCRASHTDWPAAGRYDHFAGDDAVTGRLDAFRADGRASGSAHL